jgi:hypothetical protein
LYVDMWFPAFSSAFLLATLHIFPSNLSMLVMFCHEASLGNQEFCLVPYSM